MIGCGQPVKRSVSFVFGASKEQHCAKQKHQSSLRVVEPSLESSSSSALHRALMRAQSPSRDVGIVSRAAKSQRGASRLVNFQQRAGSDGSFWERAHVSVFHADGNSRQQAALGLGR